MSAHCLFFVVGLWGWPKRITIFCLKVLNEHVTGGRGQFDGVQHCCTSSQNAHDTSGSIRIRVAACLPTCNVSVLPKYFVHLDNTAHSPTSSSPSSPETVLSTSLIFSPSALSCFRASSPASMFVLSCALAARRVSLTEAACRLPPLRPAPPLSASSSSRSARRSDATASQRRNRVVVVVVVRGE